MEKDMQITSKFDKDDVVWFYNLDSESKVKFLEGRVLQVSYWDNFTGFRYDVSHISPEGLEMTYSAEEKNMYKTKAEVTSSIFEANGVLAPAPEPEPAE